MTTNGAPQPTTLIDSTIFTTLQSKIDEESSVRDSLKAIVDTLSKQGRLTASILSRIHNVPTASLESEVIAPARAACEEQKVTVQKLAEVASKYPYYKYNQIWQRDLQNVIGSVQLVYFLGSGKLVGMEEVGGYFGIPVNIKDTDTFHISIEDYLLALCSTIEELGRLAPNAVTMGDYARPVQISRFIKDVHAGFQLLNLKNDALRRRSDGIKYAVKKVEDVVYDLSLRGLLVREEMT